HLLEHLLQRVGHARGIGTLQRHELNLELGAGTQLLDELDDLDDFLDVGRIVAADDDDIELGQGFRGHRRARSAHGVGRGRRRSGRRRRLLLLLLAVGGGMAYLVMLRIVEESQSRVILDPTGEKIAPLIAWRLAATPRWTAGPRGTGSSW